MAFAGRVLQLDAKLDSRRSFAQIGEVPVTTTLDNASVSPIK